MCQNILTFWYKKLLILPDISWSLLDSCVTEQSNKYNILNAYGGKDDLYINPTETDSWAKIWPNGSHFDFWPVSSG